MNTATCSESVASAQS